MTAPMRHVLGDLPAATQELAMRATVDEGQRHDMIMEVMYRSAEAGWTNHEILVLAQYLAVRWGKYPNTNLFLQWTRLLGMLRRVRQTYPNPAGREE